MRREDHLRRVVADDGRELVDDLGARAVVLDDDAAVLEVVDLQLVGDRPRVDAPGRDVRQVRTRGRRRGVVWLVRVAERLHVQVALVRELLARQIRLRAIREPADDQRDHHHRRDPRSERPASAPAPRAAGLSYYFLFALFPALLFLTAILGLLPVPKLMDHLLGYIARVLPADAASLLTKTLGEVIKGARGSLVSLGVLGALWGASSGMVSISNALNVAFEVRDTRTWWRHRLEAIGLTVWFSLLTIVALLLFVFGERIGDAVAQWLGVGAAFTRTWNFAGWPALALCAPIGIR